jgi:hypothetical protein
MYASPPLRSQAVNTLPADPPAAMLVNYQGFFDVANCQTLEIWAADRDRPSVVISVDIKIDGVLAATVPANQYRPDLAAYLGDNGEHGLYWSLPATYKDNAQHTIRVYFAGTTQELINSPRQVLCAGSPTTPPPATVTLNPYNGDAYFLNGVVGINTTNVGDRSFPLSVKGKIRAQEIRVELNNWPDYVFAPGYKLPTLGQTEAYLKANRHLPGIPSAREVADNGLLLGDMSSRLLQKVEELTLHLIRLEKRSRQQQTQISRLRKLTLSPR